MKELEEDKNFMEKELRMTKRELIRKEDDLDEAQKDYER